MGGAYCMHAIDEKYIQFWLEYLKEETTWKT
jgi:hypothetical protein